MGPVSVIIGQGQIIVKMVIKDNFRFLCNKPSQNQY